MKHLFEKIAQTSDLDEIRSYIDQMKEWMGAKTVRRSADFNGGFLDLTLIPDREWMRESDLPHRGIDCPALVTSFDYSHECVIVDGNVYLILSDETTIFLDSVVVVRINDCLSQWGWQEVNDAVNESMEANND